jgi:hypothetical protein
LETIITTRSPTPVKQYVPSPSVRVARLPMMKSQSSTTAPGSGRFVSSSRIVPHSSLPGNRASGGSFCSLSPVSARPLTARQSPASVAWNALRRKSPKPIARTERVEMRPLPTPSTRKTPLLSVRTALV